MITANELRKGNYVNWKGEVACISQIYEVEVGFKCGDIGLISDLEPIELSIELLLKLEFKQLPHFTISNSIFIDVLRNRQLTIGSVGTPNEILFLCEINLTNDKVIDDLVCLHNYDYDGKLYLHKLQNIYFLLTKKELNYDPK